MRYSCVWVLLVFGSVGPLNAQDRETFDITTFSAPSGWRKEIKDNVISFSITDPKAGAWAKIEIYRGVESTGNSGNDFEREWNYLMASRFEGIRAPVPESKIEDGWSTSSGSSIFQWQDKESNAALYTFTGYGYVVCVAVLSNSQQFDKTIDRVIASLSVAIP